MESGNIAHVVSLTRPIALLEPLADVIGLMGYTAVGVGPIDLRISDDYFRIMTERKLPIVHVDGTDRDGVKPYIIKEIDGVKVGIVSFGAAAANQSSTIAALKDRYRFFSEARRKSDILILLDQANLASDAWLAQNAKRLGSPDIVVGGSSRSYLGQPRQIGQTMVVPTSTQGTYVGRVDVDLDGKEKKLTFSRTAIDPTIEDDPEVLKIVNGYNERQRQALSHQSSSQSARSRQPYFQHTSCKSCHSKEYEQWKSTRHAMALNMLVKEGKAMPECLPCHSEMYRRTNRVVLSPTDPSGVECASCHLNVLPHGAGFKKKGDTRALQARCAECHTAEHSPSFRMPEYYDAVKHDLQSKPR